MCAKGALFLSRIDKFNKVRRSDLTGYVGDGVICDLLSDIFTFDQLDLIEYCFERSSDWLQELPNSADRLLGICQNVIDQGGTFKPKVLYNIVLSKTRASSPRRAK